VTLELVWLGICLPAGDVQLATEFLLLAGQLDQAFDLAAAKGQLQTFGQLAAGSIKVGADTWNETSMYRPKLCRNSRLAWAALNNSDLGQV
jgi:hypothetical protein